MEVHKSENPRESAARSLENLLERYQDQSILLMLSGGSWFTVLEDVDTSLCGPHVALSMLDERCTTDKNDSNLLTFMETSFFIQGTERGAVLIQPPVDLLSDCSTYSGKWENAIRTWKTEHPEGKVIATMGIGADGHTAGIFNVNVPMDSNEWFVLYEIPKEINEHTNRITVTYTFLKECVDDAVVYAVGENKKEVVTTLTSAVCYTTEMPACVLHEMKSVNVYT